MKVLPIVHHSLIGILRGMVGAMLGGMGGAGLGVVYLRTFLPNAELAGIIPLGLGSCLGILAGSILGPTCVQ